MLHSYPCLSYCVIQKGKYYETINITGCSDWLSYTQYKIWVSEETA
ncbi:hypothetical protein bcere0024_048380 [Bacillus cereus Rock4-18]|nr:hypothetical protein bcere0024_048380 [Bacillus cereus Rock4-18]